MATYVSNKTRAFKAPGDPCDLPLNSKSLFHLKSYKSATDPRAWAYGSEERKQYILELFAADSSGRAEMHFGKYINLHALIRTLLSNKNADISYLQSQLHLLEAFLDDLHLTEEQRTTLENLKRNPTANFEPIVPVLSKDSCMHLPKDDQQILISSAEELEALSRKFEEQEGALEHHKAVAKDALRQVAALKVIAEERDFLQEENLQLRQSLECMRNTKSSSNNDLLLKAQISELKFQIQNKDARKLSSLKMVRSDQTSIFPTPIQTHDIGEMTNETYVDLIKIIDERNILQGTVNKLLNQMANLQRFDDLMERQLPTRHDRCPGDHSSQIVQTTLANNKTDTELRKEIDFLKGRISEFEIKNLDFDRLCLRIGELQLIEKEHDDLKINYNVKLLEQRKIVGEQLGKIDYLEQQCACLQTELERYRQYQQENNILSDRCKNLQHIIESQQARVRYFENCKTYVLESGSQIDALKIELEKKSSLIKISEDKLLALQTQLRDSINSLTNEKSILKNALQEANAHIEELTEQENVNKETIKFLTDEVDIKDGLLQAFRKGKLQQLPISLQEKDNIIKQLRQRLLDLQQDNNKLNEMGRLLHDYLVNQHIHSSNSDPYNKSQNRRNSFEYIFDNLRQLQKDIGGAKHSCDANDYMRLQAKYKEIQSIAKGQVHWIAAGLRKCKEDMQPLQCRFKKR